MSRVSLRVSGAVILFGCLAATMPSRGDDRSPDAILKEIDSITVPVLDESRANDPAYMERFNKEHGEAASRRAKLIGALYRSDPENPRLATLLPERWEALAGMVESREDRKRAQELTAELNEVIARTKSKELTKDAVYYKAQAASTTAKDLTTKTKAVDEFIALDPKDERGAKLLFDLGFTALFDNEPAVQRDLYARVAKEYPESGWAETARGKARQFDALGMPFDLEFTDAISGAEISTKGLKGKVVLIHFWATDADGEIPTLKKLHAEYKNKGIALIGISLDLPEDQGGLEKLKEFVAKNAIDWPQYYQGKGWQSEFSQRWGIDSIPRTFLIDAEGNLYSMKARGKLDTMIPALLAKPQAPDAPEAR
jgi:peroxiredoxin